MALEKLKIKNRDTGDEFEVLFNPTEYTLEDANSWEEQKRERRKPELQFTGQSLKKLAMDLFVDTYEPGSDVREHTGKLAALMVASIDASNGKRPPVCELSWGPKAPGSGDFPFVGVLESLKQQFVLFLGNGTPVRARLAVSFKEFTTPVEDEKKNPKNNSFPARVYTVRAGDSLSSIAQGLWRRPAEWRRIAEKNGIDNPRLIAPGSVLLVPPID